MGIPSKYLNQTVDILRQGSASFDAYGNPSQSYSANSSNVKARLERQSGTIDVDDEEVLQYTMYEMWNMYVDVGTDITRKDRVSWTYNSTSYDFDVMDVEDVVGSTSFHHKLVSLQRIT
tara:strand:+ start:1406 stop:1762 length:357 start_codon:yes stop_codon:yes gene_type:complete